MNSDTERLGKIEQRLTEILERLGRIEEQLSRVGSSCRGLDSHISFVEGVYSTVRRPLDYIVQSVTSLMGEEPSLSLPAHGDYPALEGN